ncbi:hypothetical protein [Microbacterium paraoxydans]|uniref:hypothetical protein n=1 Tax=Microbacterium paraoxydans TaxID=199592 RepID=UPI000469574A|nr:hypothetical protein [Microbacterium paraoxydans]
MNATPHPADLEPHAASIEKSTAQRASRSQAVRIIIAIALVAVALAAAFFIIQALQPAPTSATVEAPSRPSTQAQSTPEPTRTPAATPASVPTADVTLGATGGEAELDRCDQTFTHIVAYGTDLPPVWAAHNDCGGDVILPWSVGQEITLAVDGALSTYTIVDARDTRKNGATTDDLTGITGDLVLQTCYYGQDRMKFIGLSPAAQ